MNKAVLFLIKTLTVCRYFMQLTNSFSRLDWPMYFIRDDIAANGKKPTTCCATYTLEWQPTDYTTGYAGNQGIPQPQRRMSMHPLRRTVQHVSHYRVQKKYVDTILLCP